MGSATGYSPPQVLPNPKCRRSLFNCFNSNFSKTYLSLSFRTSVLEAPSRWNKAQGFWRDLDALPESWPSSISAASHFINPCFTFNALREPSPGVVSLASLLSLLLTRVSQHQRAWLLCKRQQRSELVVWALEPDTRGQI